MTKLLLKLPWFLATPLVIVVAGGFAFVGFRFTGDYFRETCANERNLLTGEFEPSNCGEGADVARALEQPLAAGTPTSASNGNAGGTVAAGTFRNGDPGHEGRGMAELQQLPDGRLNIFLKGFSVTNGPELWVVLSKSADGTYADGDLFVEKLKANNGSQNYAAPPGTNAADFGSVIIWCRPFRVTFARASLMQSGGVTGAAQPAASQPPGATAPGGSASPATPAGAATEPTPPPASASTATARPAAPTAAAASTRAPATAAAQGVVARGSLRDGAPGHMGRGAVEIQRLTDGKLNVFVGNLSVTNGPDLYIVLSRSDDGDYGDGDLVLQKLKANNGSQNYALPESTDLSRYRSLLIWCRQFDITFSYAQLEVQ